MKKIIGGFTIFIALVFTKNVEASTYETVYKNNVVGSSDYRYDYTYNIDSDYYMMRNLSGWWAKDNYGSFTLSYSSSTSGTFTNSYTGSLSISGNLARSVIGTAKISKTISYSYTSTEMTGYTFTISPETPGNFHAISLNSWAAEHRVKIYKQKFKWFGQGDYEYESSAKFITPKNEFRGRVYKYNPEGTIYRTWS